MSKCKDGDTDNHLYNFIYSEGGIVLNSIELPEELLKVEKLKLEYVTVLLVYAPEDIEINHLVYQYALSNMVLKF